MYSLRLTVVIFFSFFCVSFLVAQHFPGGVSGAEVWYMADEADFNNGDYIDYSTDPIQIESCNDHDITLFNFNPSLESDRLCLQYRSSLERSLSRSMFIVTEPENNQDSYSHIATAYNEVVPDILGTAYEDSLSMNTYIIETKQGYGSRMVSNFSQHQNTHVHFYSWDNYDVDKIHKDYGQLGETDFFIGRNFSHPDLDQGLDFSGLLPEYIAFDRQLSENERNRVESYLALKYGITKWHTEHYQNARNKIFWDKANNPLFGNNIFGIGRDDISGLNQLMCESAHARDYLVAGAYQILTTNAEAQHSFSIFNNEFLVFGDTGEGGIQDENNKGLRRLNKVWLAQVRGERIKEISIHFRLDLMQAFEDDPGLVDQVVNEELVVWMLHDPLVNNGYVSDFEGENIEYYKPFDIEPGPNGEIYAHFGADEIFFDQDGSFFDQFTFAIGPEVIVQFQPDYSCDEAAEGPVECYQLHIIIVEGGGAVEELHLFNEGWEGIEVWFNDEQTELTGDITYTADICAPDIYTTVVHTPNGSFEYEYEAEVIGPYVIDLGPPIQYLSASQPEIELDAGQYLNDPETLYQWYFNDEPIYHYDPVLIADQPGYYCVVVTTADRVCEYTHCVEVVVRLDAELYCEEGWCDFSGNKMHINILDGAAPYTIEVTDENGQTVTYVEHSDTIVLENFEEGDYNFTVTDALGASYQQTCSFSDSFEVSVSMGPDLTLDSSNTQFTLDTSGVTTTWGSSHTYQYEWLYDDGINGEKPLSDTTPQLTVSTPGEYTAKIYIEEFDCYGYAGQTVLSTLEGTISQDSDCDEFTNTINIAIDFGFAPYTIFIDGEEYPSGTPYTDMTSSSSGSLPLNIPIMGIPYGVYDVTVSDKYQNMIEELDVEFLGLQLDIHSQLYDAFDWLHNPPDFYAIYEGDCGVDIPFLAVDAGLGFTLDASTLINNSQNVSYEWFSDGVSLGYFDPVINFVPGSEQCDGLYSNLQNPCIDNIYNDPHPIHTVKVTDNVTGCTISQSFAAISWWCPVLDPPVPPPSYNTTIYPNPGDSDVTFYYSIDTTGEEAFSGTVEVFSMLGSLIYSNKIEGSTAYTLPYRLVATGAYIIRTTTDDGTVTIDRVIIK